MADKIIHSFQQRRQLAQAFEQLAQTETEQALLEQVQALAREYPADLLLNMLIRHLDTTSSQLRGGLGHLAALLPPVEAAAALRSAAANRKLSPQTRMTAALISDRFLGETIPPALLHDVAGSNDVAFQSLLEAVEEGKHNRHVLLEYVLQMREMGQDIAFLVMDALDRLPAADRPPLLRLIAHDARLAVAQRAIERLSRLAEKATADDNTEADRADSSHESFEVSTDASTATDRMSAAKALHVLQFTLPARLAELIARANRKLRFAGAGYNPPAPDAWRGLMSPADMGGNQTIWCFRRPAGESPGALLGLVVNPRFGIVQAFGSETIAPEHLPQTQAVGQMTLMKTDSGDNAVLLEAPFDFCRARILAALEATWQSEPPRDLPPEYQLYSDLIWQFAPPQIDATLARFFRPRAQAVDATPANATGPDAKKEPPTEHGAPEALDVQAAYLLRHPAMSHWRVQNRMLQQLLRRARLDADNTNAGTAGASDIGAGETKTEVIRVVLSELAARPETVQISEAMISGLQAQAAWLHIAGDERAAEAAYALAQALPGRPPQENPLLTHMIAVSIGVEL